MAWLAIEPERRRPGQSDYFIKVKRDGSSWISKQLGIVARQEKYKHSIICLIKIPGFSQKAKIHRYRPY